MSRMDRVAIVGTVWGTLHQCLRQSALPRLPPGKWLPQGASLRQKSESRNKVSVGEPAEGSLPCRAAVPSFLQRSAAVPSLPCTCTLVPRRCHGMSVPSFSAEIVQTPRCSGAMPGAERCAETQTTSNGGSLGSRVDKDCSKAR